MNMENDLMWGTMATRRKGTNIYRILEMYQVPSTINHNDNIYCMHVICKVLCLALIHDPI